jgi:hypothetical protein
MTESAKIFDLRPELERPPQRIADLPRRRGYPVPWFVDWIVDGKSAPIGEGEPDFRIMSGERWKRAIEYGDCWVCGQKMGTYRAFTVGPMCAINRTSAEPPSHRDCAEWSARNCPFLARPHARRREAGMVEGTVAPPGISLMRNPGVALVWVTKRGRYRLRREVDLFDIGEPEEVSWWAEGREATRAEVDHSIDTGYPALFELADEEGADAVKELNRMVSRARTLLPA